MACKLDTLAADLGRLGVLPGDVLMLHASMRAIGPIEGGAAALITALDRAVTETGTLLMMIGAPDDPAEPFEYTTTPADPKVGVLAEVFRTTPGTLASDHPEGRFVARGRLSRHFVENVPWHDYYGPDSPLHRLVDARGKILRLGADRNTVTLLHYSEYLADLPNKRRVRRVPRIKTANGIERKTVECLDDCDGIAPYAGGDYFADILTAFLEASPGGQGLVGRAQSELIDAAALADFGARWIAANLR